MNNIKLYIITLILIPIFAISIIYISLENKELKYNTTTSTTKKLKKQITTKETKLDSNIKIKINNNNEILELNLEEYIIGVVAAEMPASFEIEALKAQAVTSRTYAIYKLEQNKNNYDIETTVDDQVFITKNEMKDKWLDDYELYYNKIKEAVIDTKNEIMKKNNKIFKSYYFAMSNGMTSDSKTVFGETITNSVTSPWDNEELNKFKVSTEFTLNDIKTKLNLKENIKSIKILSRDNTNRVEKVRVNDKEYTGIEFRKILNLRSTDFTIESKNNMYYITTKGYGHGVGMSQYGANGMAKENYTYKEILEYYYQDIEITTI